MRNRTALRIARAAPCPRWCTGKAGLPAGSGDCTLAAADEAISKWTRHGLETGKFRGDIRAFEAIRRFLLAHDEQLSTATRAAVSVALADQREVCNTVNPLPAVIDTAVPPSDLSSRMKEGNMPATRFRRASAAAQISMVHQLAGDH
ncbi:hypothetical protein [Paraburkholderia sp. GAS348]|uniref:hypothetical protein n=1 Tax=Paraburkholderia sp. GAS348 TaxID=3035132 RepID=UPI003D2592CF